MKHFDANAMIGEHFAPREGRWFQAEDLLKAMDFFGIDEALAYHGLAREYDFQIGNRRLRDEVRKSPRLHAAWVVGLHHTSSLPPPRALMDEAMAEGIKAVRLFFGGLLSDSAFVDRVAYDGLFRELAEHALPTLVEFEGPAGLTAEHLVFLDDVLGAFPDLPVILGNPAFRAELRNLYPRMEKYPNLHLEISGFHANGLIEDLVESVGAGRLIFGTHFPWFSPGQTRIALAYAQIRADEREQIAYRNLHSLMEKIRK